MFSVPGIKQDSLGGHRIMAFAENRGLDRDGLTDRGFGGPSALFQSGKNINNGDSSNWAGPGTSRNFEVIAASCKCYLRRVGAHVWGTRAIGFRAPHIRQPL